MSMFKGLGNLASLVKQAQQLGGRMQELTEQLKSRRATGAAGGGLIEVEVNGLGEVLRCHIDKSLLEGRDNELVEDLLVAATNQALAKAKQLHTEAFQSLSGEMDMPGLNEALTKLTGEPMG
jgi:nucleoid-associated protein EbfC